ncbi:NAD(P)/FAD-dependent oxidoreductase [Oharaeibacter diazotrophicus]|uniref:Glycine/D-amino acid oxidase-like deaminating enzyme n=1 Tax=Oharaeibacter diazotrophicus TaxID=1920512 RepID=A0A4V6PVI4_9HYPH|nr:FAD-binding oxidoreductase [Oharaeibacter diazotrophicus]TDP86938.1 glycine/D-amino acid oxidase-like deaminating enzyme [Oharaeibacter diazotrophicus]BBE71119.1 4-methylaminobutanoate oxidase (formaldehyde-forming) [Pleomorphomonas sp. SM30]GLS77873.1 FAD-dependent oxidoreductase [Oharaeibacter diazotrophicus]
MAHYDVVIIGGAVTGSSVAYHLAADPAFGGRVLVVEKDPTYQACASALSAASIRQQFSTAVNVEISLYGIRFLREIGERLAVGDERPVVDLHEGGYLFLATAAGRPVLEENHALQTRLGADILFLEPEQLVERFPWLAVDDVVAGCWGRTGEGWFDGYGLMQAFRKKARSLGVEYRATSAAAVVTEGGRVTGVRLADGEVISCGAVVNAAGRGGREIARSAGCDIPIEVKKRMIFTFKCADEVRNCPLLIDPNGTYVRPEGDGFLCGSAPPEDRDPEFDGDFTVDWPLFEELIWPTLATRVPAFERIRPGRAWAGYYDMCAFDHNVLLGRAPDVDGLYLANGFSGHGLQQSPAVGRGLAELIVHGRYTTLDLSELDPARVAAGRRVAEKNVV